MTALGTSGNKDTAFVFSAWGRRLYNQEKEKERKKEEGIPE